jgi:hypothetical protein
MLSFWATLARVKLSLTTTSNQCTDYLLDGGLTIQGGALADL